MEELIQGLVEGRRRLQVHRVTGLGDDPGASEGNTAQDLRGVTEHVPVSRVVGRLMERNEPAAFSRLAPSSIIY